MLRFTPDSAGAEFERRLGEALAEIERDLDRAVRESTGGVRREAQHPGTLW